MSERQEDQNLAREQFSEMNRKFYTAEFGPKQYIELRLRALFLGSSELELVEQAAAEGFSVGKLNVSYASNDKTELARETSDFLITESSVLLHHAGETFLRLYFAHAELPECPWLETARLRSFSVFKSKVQRLVDSLDAPEVQYSIMNAFTGSPTLDRRPEDIPDGAWIAQRDGLIALLGCVGRVILSDANLYNAAKHGLAVFPADLGVSLDTPDMPDGLDLSVRGRALQYLQVAQGAKGKYWEERWDWVSAESNLTITHLVAQQVGALMNVARARYVGLPEGGFRIDAITAEMVEAAIGIGRQPGKTIVIQSMGQGLLYYADPQAPSGEANRDAPAEAPLT